MTIFMFNGDKVRTSQIVTVDGIKLPPLKSMDVQYFDIQATAYRDMSEGAYLHKETVAYDKIKLVCNWGYTSKDEAQIILNALKGKEYGVVRFFNPLSARWEEINAYRGDREVKIYRENFDEDENVAIDYSGVTLNFIEL